MSYIFQGCLALFLYLVTKISSTWIRKVFHLISFAIPNARGHGQKIQDKLQATKLGAAAKASLVEFHEVQMFFVASIQIATFLSFKSKLSGPISNSYLSSILNGNRVGIFSTSGAFTTLLTQCGLQRAGMRWWYTFLGTSIVLCLSLAIVNGPNILLPDPDMLWAELKQMSPVEACGNNPSPMVLCSDSIIVTNTLLNRLVASSLSKD